MTGVHNALDAGEDLNVNGQIDWIRYVTLDGPDWPPLDPNGNGNPADPTDVFEGVVLSGVVGVYTTTVELDR